MQRCLCTAPWVSPLSLLSRSTTARARPCAVGMARFGGGSRLLMTFARCKPSSTVHGTALGTALGRQGGRARGRGAALTTGVDHGGEAKRGITVILKRELESLIEDAEADYTLLDVREPNETVEGMIPTANALPLSCIEAALQLNKLEFENNFGFSKPRWQDTIIVYCRSGVRSDMVAKLMTKNGFMDVKNYKGSWLEWSNGQ